MRRIRKVATLLSLLALCLASVAAYRSRAGEMLERVTPNRRIVINSVGGQFEVMIWTGPFAVSTRPHDYGAAPPQVWLQWMH